MCHERLETLGKDVLGNVADGFMKEEFIYTPPPRVGKVPNASSSGPVALPKNMCVPVAPLHIFCVRATSRLTL
jgi:hypothetical protein